MAINLIDVDRFQSGPDGPTNKWGLFWILNIVNRGISLPITGSQVNHTRMCYDSKMFYFSVFSYSNSAHFLRSLHLYCTHFHCPNTGFSLSNNEFASLWRYQKEIIFLSDVYLKSLVCSLPGKFCLWQSACWMRFKLWCSCLLTLQTTMNTSRNLSWWQYQFAQSHNDLVTRRCVICN